jgi:hypothetical protein
LAWVWPSLLQAPFVERRFVAGNEFPLNLNIHEGLIRYMSLGKLVVPVTEQYTIHGKTRAVFISTTVIACYPVLPDCIHVGY